MSHLAPWTACMLAGLVSATLTMALASLGLRARWIDRRDGGDPLLLARKPRRSPVPLVGGAALVLCLACFDAFGGAGELPWPALLVAFAVGTLDDRLPAGLDWRAKLAGQTVAATMLAWRPELAVHERAAWIAVGVAAQNAANTFDNADGALAGLAALALRSQPVVLGALLGFLPANLVSRPGPERVPRAYLGDAGSHVIGILWAADPRAWPVLLLPLLDLLRLVVLRRSLGQPPWRGDRRHLAHRLAARGLGPVAVVVCLLGIALPAAFLARGGLARVLGALGTALLFACALRFAPAAHE
jgi:UDP-GlcNAc:undecaprenyl-phosphate GlcNAc-1-phosphate transferase